MSKPPATARESDEPKEARDGSEFSRFEALTKRLLAVPKEAIDKARANGRANERG